MYNYGLDIWGNNNFAIKNGNLIFSHQSEVALIDIVQDLKRKGLQAPYLLKFDHLVKKQLDTLFSTFYNNAQLVDYKGEFKAVFPIKSNQTQSFINPTLKFSENYNYGLEAGSKAELLLIIAKTRVGTPLLVNGYKDKDLIELSFMAKKMGHAVTVTLESKEELFYFLEFCKTYEKSPDLGLRIKLQSTVEGHWQKSTGFASKFGLNSAELIYVLNCLKERNYEDRFKLLHFHLGSQMDNVFSFKRALEEAMNIYAALIKMGAKNLDILDIGGGQSIEYNQSKTSKSYDLDRFIADALEILQSKAKIHGVKEPNIIAEAGRFISAPSAIFITDVIARDFDSYDTKFLNLKNENPKQIEKLHSLLNNVRKVNAIDSLKEAKLYIQDSMRLFQVEDIDLIDKANAEVLYQTIIKKVIEIVEIEELNETLFQYVKDRFLLNFSLFANIPDSLIVNQVFPIMPIHKLNQKANIVADVWDITCDSDGEFSCPSYNPIRLHNIKVNEEYYIGFFLTGAYQETLVMRHNLIGLPNIANVLLSSNDYEIYNIIKAENASELFSLVGYDTEEIRQIIKKLCKSEQDYKNILAYFEEDSYFKKIV